MYCPSCSSRELRVLDSRPYFELNQVKRRRQCCYCEYRFTTTEVIESGMPKVIKRSGALAEFDATKVRNGIMRAIDKRPLTLGQLDAVIEKILQRINKMQVKHLRSEQVGYMIIEELKELDLVAMIRFASVYHAFQDAESFKVFIDEILTNKQICEPVDEE